MAVSNFNQTFNTTNTPVSGTAVDIPVTAFDISLTVAGAVGGAAGGDSGGPGGGGGTGKVGVFTLPNYTARTLTLRPGAIGINGPGCFGRGTAPSGGAIPGGGGGSASGCSGSGGSGGGASGVVDSLSGFYIVIAGGGGGGGGGAWNRPGGGALPASPVSDWIVNTGQFSGVAAAGNNGSGAACGDGSGGGGGGGGAGTAAAGGNGGCDNGGTASGGRAGLSTYYVPSGISLVSTSTNSGAGYITLSFTSVLPEILSFFASPNPQTSGGSGVPNNSTTFTWTTLDITKVQILEGFTVLQDNLPAGGTSTINTGLQSIAGSVSPAQKVYRLRAFYGAYSVTSDPITVSVYNDNSPNSFSIPTTTTTGVSLTNLEASTLYQVQIGPISGIDMITKVESTSPSVDFSTNQANWGNPIYITDGQTIFCRFNSLPFSLSPSGLTNSKTINYTVGTTSGSFTVTTRAPNLNEKFEFGGSETNYPFPDIDVVANTPQQYIISPTTVTVGNLVGPVDDAEIPVEIKTSNPDIEVRVKTQGSATFGNWQSVRQI